MASAAFQSLSTMSSGFACWTRRISFANSSKKTRANSSSKGRRLQDEQFLYLTTRGRRNGRLREIEIWFTQCDGCFFVIAEYPTSNWVQNIRANPLISIRVAGGNFTGHGRLLDAQSDPDLYARIQSLSRKKYGWGEGQVVELTPDTPG